MRSSGIVNDVDAQTIEFDEALLIEGYLEQAKEALQLAEEAMHAVFEADSLLSWFFAAGVSAFPRRDDSRYFSRISITS